jgi:hypothetical protein
VVLLIGYLSLLTPDERADRAPRLRAIALRGMAP